MVPLSYPEAARERDLQRYYQPWLDAQNLVHATDGRGLTYKGYQAQNSHDKALTAFAQLAALRLDVRRAMVSLIASNHQYILAEATRTLSLYTQEPDRSEDKVWLGHSIIARTDAVCHHTFNSTYTAYEENGEPYIAQALIIPDCRLDSRVSSKDYVQSEPGVRFYAGVPITTKNGHHIGVYAVSDDKPRDGLKAADVRFLHDVAAAVMEHLELAKDSDARITGERMVRGLAEFIERSSLHERNSPGQRSTTLEKQTENARLDAIGDEDPPSALPVTRHPSRKREHERELDASRIFQRAARIIRHSTHADGVVFFDTSAAHISSHASGGNPTPVPSSDEDPYSSTTAGSTTASRKRRREKDGILAINNTESAESIPDPQVESKPCPIVGLSIRTGLATATEIDFHFTEASMARYIAKYPYGKFFNFDAEGTGINSSDEKSERSETEHSDKPTEPAKTARRPKKGKDRFIPTEFLKVLPNVRSIIFLPLWDPASERWAAGGFIWTMATGRLLNPENELPYLKAFGNSITSEVARWNAQRSDRAKTTFIASISHELRSPLHGILGSVEFLRDSISSGYQQSLVSSIETCGKTLLDTIDHVLDYAKINKLRSASSRRKQRVDGRTQRLPEDNSILGVTTVFDLGQLVEEVCDTVCTGHTFRKTHDILNVTFHDQERRSREFSTMTGDSNAGNLSPSLDQSKDRVVVTINVTPFVPWIVRSQPGALRRVVMNLLGNALKYTNSGFITVSLSRVPEQPNPNAIGFQLTVEDSGKGMSTEYQHTKLFTPFSQENPFSNGTGLGLSIVKQIVESLKGEIDVRSTINIGTKVSIFLKLPTGSIESARMSKVATDSPKELKDKVAGIAFPSTSIDVVNEKLRESIVQSCHGLYMKTTEELDLENNPPRFLFTEPGSLLKILGKQKVNGTVWPPPDVVCICTDPTEKSAIEGRLFRQFPSLGWVIDLVVQPCGPQKLAKILLDSQIRASQGVQSLQVEPTDPSIIPSSALKPSPGPKIAVHRSVSDMVRGSSAVLSPVAATHSPLISATMPSREVSPYPLAESQIPNMVASEAPNEYLITRVLLVDDNAINLKLLVVFAQRQNLRYSSATDGLTAFEKFKSEALTTDPPSKPFDYILMDLQMPIMGGLESTRRIRQWEAEKGLQKCTIVALTGLASAQDQQDAVDAGVDTYLVKPVKFADIKRIFGAK